MHIMDYICYKEFTQSWVLLQPKKGYGMWGKIAECLGKNSVQVSQIFKGDRDLGLDQSYLLTKFMKLTPLETKYFMAMVSHGHSGHFEAKEYWLDQLKSISGQFSNVKNRIKGKENELSKKDQSVFYSSWIYSAVRICCDIPKFNHPSEIASYLGVSVRLVEEALQFLISVGLVKKVGTNKLEVGATKTHVSKISPHVRSHWKNWHLKAISKFEEAVEKDHLFFSATTAVDKKTAKEIKKILLDSTEKSFKTLESSKSEVVYTLNIDWFEL